MTSVDRRASGEKHVDTVTQLQDVADGEIKVVWKIYDSIRNEQDTCYGNIVQIIL